MLDTQSSLYKDAVEGLRKTQKELKSKYFYDETGSELFEQICELEEYYPTDCEIEIMQENVAEMSRLIGPRVQLVELGSGSSLKTRLLLDVLEDVASYVPVDISGDFLQSIAQKLNEEYTDLPIHPVAADYTMPFHIPDIEERNRRVVYYPGSTIGNFTRENARTFLADVAGMLAPGDGLLIGVDMKKDTDVLELAYDDPKGVTAAFNKNVLQRLNHELDANFDLNQFEHDAFYNIEEGRIEMHLRSLADQTVTIGSESFSFREGETIHTENSHKYNIGEFEELASDHFNRLKSWTDSRSYFSVHYFVRT